MTPVPLLYDPDCGFCRVCAAVLLRWDGERRLRPVALKSTEAEELLAGMSEEQQMASWHLVDSGCVPSATENVPLSTHPASNAGTVRSGGAAFSPLFRLLPGGAPLALLAERFPRASDRAYRWVADRRSAFGRPVPPALRRWADRVISESSTGSR